MSILRGAIWSVPLAVVGLALGEYWPVFSGYEVRELCDPFSPCRNEGALVYVLGGFLLGFLLGFLDHTSAARRRRTGR